MAFPQKEMIEAAPKRIVRVREISRSDCGVRAFIMSKSPIESGDAALSVLGDAPVAGDHVPVGEVRFWVAQHGTGAPLLFLHGLPTSSYLWRNVQRLLGGEFATYAVDLLGCGRTEAPESVSLRLEDQADLLPGLLDALDLEQVVLVAHDIGGAVAQYFAARHPQRVRALILMDVVTFPRHWPVALVRFLRLPLLGASLRLAPRPILRLILKSRLRKGLVHRQRLNPTVFAEYARRLLAPDGTAEFLRLIRGFDPASLERSIYATKDAHLPRLILWADEDVYQPLPAGQKLFDLVTSGKFVHISDAGHFLPEDQPERVAQEMRTYLRALPPSH